MSYLSSLPGDGGLAETFRAYPDSARPLLDLHEAVMRAPSPFTPAERELMAAYVSGLNRCEFCRDSHVAAADVLGVPEPTAAAALADLDSAPVDERLKPVLRYLGKLTQTPAQITAADAAAVLAAGWDEQALHNAVLVCALFNFMNRMVDGLGIAASPEELATTGRMLGQVGYAGLATTLGGAAS